MKVPINQKFMLTITEAAEYFGMGTKVLRKFAADHQEVSIRYGKRWRIIREKYQIYRLYGRILTPDGLRLICAALDYDPEKIGKHMLEMLAKFRSEGIIEQ